MMGAPRARLHTEPCVPAQQEVVAMKHRLPRSLMVLAALAFLSSAGAAPPQGLDLYFIDVMGGAATLVVTPERESVLIDSGWPGFEDRDPERIAEVIKFRAGLDHL